MSLSLTPAPPSSPLSQPQPTPNTPHPRRYLLTTTPLVDENANRLSQAFVSQIESFYQRHPRYARFAKQHPTLNKSLMITAVVATLTLPLWLRSLTKVGFGLALHRLPKPNNWKQGGVWFTGLLVGATAASALIQQAIKKWLPTPAKSLSANKQQVDDIPSHLLLP